MRIALLSCSKAKKPYPCPARELYSASTLFSLSYQYAKAHADQIYILSAKYGLVAEDTVLEPYDQTLADLDRAQQLLWAEGVLASLCRVCRPEEDTFLLLAGTRYCRDLTPHLPHCQLPLEGLPMGMRMARLKQLLAGDGAGQSPAQPVRAPEAAPPCAALCGQLHALFNQLPRYTWTQISDLPFSNGIYILFEQGEVYHGLDRIVRVGTHTAPDRLKLRLTDHFVRENHDGSIFRKNIGKAVLHAHRDPYLAVWSLDTSKPENAPALDREKNADTERRVSKYMREHFTFTAFPVEDKEDRLRLEEAIISTLHHTGDFRPSGKWAGKYSPEEKIRQSGMWLKQGLDAPPLTEAEWADILRRCGVSPAKAAYTGKYTPLYQFLCAQQTPRVVLPFSQIEQLLGFPLPKSARLYPAWWTPTATHTHCQAWTAAGYHAINIPQGIASSQMTFLRTSTSK